MLLGKMLPRVEVYKYLGVFIDRLLSFELQLKYLFQRGRQAFLAFNAVTHALLFPFPMQAAAFPCRVESCVAYGIEFAALAPGAEAAA